MEFCPKCGLALVVKVIDEKKMLACRKCGYATDKYRPMKISEKIEKNPLDKVVIVEKGEDALPKTKATCPKCANNEAVWWIQQTRSADEAPTLFFRCTKCKHSWREYG